MNSIGNKLGISKNSYGLYSFSQYANSRVDREEENIEPFESAIDKKCRELIEQSKNEVNDLVEKALKDGENSGYKERFESEKEKVASKYLNQFDEIKRELEILNDTLKSDAENKKADNQYLELAVTLAKSIIKNELETNDEVYFGLYKKAAQHISNVATATLKTTAKGAKTATENMKKYTDQIDSLQELKLEEVNENEGYCLLQTGLGNIDSSIDKQLERALNIVKPKA